MPLKILITAWAFAALILGIGLAAEMLLQPTTFGHGWLFIGSLVTVMIVVRTVLNSELYASGLKRPEPATKKPSGAL